MIHANYQKQATVAKLKKAYANLCNAVKLSELDNGPLNEWELPNLNYTTAGYDEFFDKYLSPYMKTNKYDKNSQNKWKRYNIDGEEMPSFEYEFPWYKLQDGTALDFYSQQSSTRGYFWVFIDINGAADPNRLGRDIFMFDIYKKNKPEFWMSKFTIAQLKNDPEGNYSCKKGTGNKYAGGFCGAMIFNNGFEMPKDYPL